MNRLVLWCLPLFSSFVYCTRFSHFVRCIFHIFLLSVVDVLFFSFAKKQPRREEKLNFQSRLYANDNNKCNWKIHCIKIRRWKRTAERKENIASHCFVLMGATESNKCINNSTIFIKKGQLCDSTNSDESSFCFFMLFLRRRHAIKTNRVKNGWISISFGCDCGKLNQQTGSHFRVSIVRWRWPRWMQLNNQKETRNKWNQKCRFASKMRKLIIYFVLVISKTFQR